MSVPLPLPPAQPAYIFRGHAAQIHCTRFIRANTRLVTGDAEGWIVIWSLASRRSTAVWRAHEGAILGVAEWGTDRLITHGKDNKLLVWKFPEQDESSLDTSLPVEDPSTPRRQPWLLHVLHVNTLNFCSFGHCKAQQLPDTFPTSLVLSPDHDDLLIAVPNTMDSEAIDIFHLPSQARLSTIPGPKPTNTGMAMSLSILYLSARLTLVVGYESGHSMVTQHIPTLGWHILYLAQPHSQPILSLAITPIHAFYLTSGADAIIAKHPLSSLSPASTPQAPPQPSNPPNTPANPPSALSAALAQSTPLASTSARPASPPETATKPLRLVQTKHSGQQSLRIRSDGRIFATAGWDARVRVYSSTSMKELAVLKWHKEGCYAVAFAEVLDGKEEGGESGTEGGGGTEGSGTSGMGSGMESEGGEVSERPRRVGLMTSARERRILQATHTHWVAAGSKDGKVSLWEVY